MTAKVLVYSVIGEDGRLLAELLQSTQATRAGAAGIHQAANRGKVALFEPGDVPTDLRHSLNDVVTGTTGLPICSTGKPGRITSSIWQRTESCFGTGDRIGIK
jgi:hypothetical protein